MTADNSFRLAFAAAFIALGSLQLQAGGNVGYVFVVAGFGWLALALLVAMDRKGK